VSDFLFVYGTLRSEFENSAARRLRAEAHLIGRATVKGSLFRIAHYPGYRPQPDGVVHGELYRLKNAGATLAELDDYEGPEYTRVMVRVTPATTGDGTAHSAWIYQYGMEPPAGLQIPSGDFCAA
jgi:gamma-glutamylcyclotransferase (GGCT)/AIG2-like uncharacterized protein YtfP